MCWRLAWSGAETKPKRANSQRLRDTIAGARTQRTGLFGIARTHNHYVSKLTQAIKLLGDKGRESKWEKSNVDIGVRHIEKLTKRYYNGIDIF